MARLISRRKLVYYTIVVTSVCWILGTISFFLIQSLEVSIDVKRRAPKGLVPAESLTLNAFLEQDRFTKKSNKRVDEHDKPTETTKHYQFHIKTSFAKGVIFSHKFPKKTVFITANYERFPPGVKLKSPGAGGAAVSVPKSRRHEEDEGFDQHSFNLVASDMISLHRKLRDHRNSG